MRNKSISLKKNKDKHCDRKISSNSLVPQTYFRYAGFYLWEDLKKCCVAIDIRYGKLHNSMSLLFHISNEIEIVCFMQRGSAGENRNLPNIIYP